MSNNLYKFSKVFFLLFFICVSLIGSTAYGQEKADVPYRKQLLDVEENLRSGRFERGLEILDEISNSYPQASDIYYAKSLIYSQLRDSEMALQNAELAYEHSKGIFYTNYLLQLYKGQKQFDKAIALLNDFKASNSKNSGESNLESLNRELLILYASDNKPELAESLYKDLIQKPHSDTLSLVMAEVYLNHDDLNAAKKILEPLNGKTLIGDVYGYLGYISSNQGQPKRGVSIIQKGLKKTHDENLYLDLADSYRRLNNTKAMFGSLNQAFESRSVPFYEKYRFLISLLQEKQNSQNEQIRILVNKLIEVHPDILDAQMLKGEILLGEGEFSDAQSIFLKVVSSNPNLDNAWRQLIYADLQLGQVDQAIVDGQQALKYHARNPELLYLTSLAYQGNENYNAAQKFLEAALDYSGDQQESMQSVIYGALGDLYHIMKLESLSDIAYQEAIALDSTNVSALNNYAYYLSERQKDLEKAAQYAKLSNELEPNSATFMDTYAWVLYQKGDYQQALSWIDKAVKLNGSSAVLFDHYGDILNKLNRTKEALAKWNEALALYSDSNDQENSAKIQEKINQK